MRCSLWEESRWKDKTGSKRMWLVEVKVKLVVNPGKLGRLIRGAQSEPPTEKRQSGVVDIDGGLRQGVH